MCRDVEDPLRLVFVERWADRDALHAHFSVPASGDFVRAAEPLTAEPPHHRHLRRHLSTASGDGYVRLAGEYPSPKVSGVGWGRVSRTGPQLRHPGERRRRGAADRKDDAMRFMLLQNYGEVESELRRR